MKIISIVYRNMSGHGVLNILLMPAYFIVYFSSKVQQRLSMDPKREMSR